MVSVESRPGLRSFLIDSGQPRQRPSYRDDLVTALLGVWFAVGLFLDAWAHNNIPELESFFTPWHAVFYSGFAATGAWILWLIWRNLQSGRRGMAAVPIGYGLALVGLPVFAIAGAGDYLWHTIFGIEQNLTILFSPTHVALVSSMVVILTSPLRAAWSDPNLPAAPSFGRLLPALLSLSFASSLVLLFTQYANAASFAADTIVGVFSYQPGQRDGGAGEVASMILFTNLLLVAPLLFLARRWRLPFGVATLLCTALAGLSGAINGFENLSTVVTLVVAGIAIDLLAAWIRPAADRRYAFWGFGAAASFVTWALYFAIASITVGQLPSVNEIWTGAPIVQTFMGLLVAVLMLPNATTAER